MSTRPPRSSPVHQSCRSGQSTRCRQTTRHHRAPQNWRPDLARSRSDSALNRGQHRGQSTASAMMLAIALVARTLAAAVISVTPGESAASPDEPPFLRAQSRRLRALSWRGRLASNQSTMRSASRTLRGRVRASELSPLASSRAVGAPATGRRTPALPSETL